MFAGQALVAATLDADPLEGQGRQVIDQIPTGGCINDDLFTEADVLIDSFAEELVEKTGMTWAAKIPDVAPMILNSAVRAIVIGMQRMYGVITFGFDEDKDDNGRPSIFRVTPHGQIMLAALDPRKFPKY